MKKTFFLFLAVFLIILLFSSFLWLSGARYTVTRADISHNSFSVDNSYFFVSPLRAQSNNKEKIRLTIFILNNQGLGVMGKKISLESIPNLRIEANQTLTDSFGKAIYDISANKAGEYYLKVKVDHKNLPQKAHLSFY